MNSPESLIARILKWAVALFIAAIVLRWTVCIIMEIWWVLVLLAAIGIGIYVAFRVWKNRHGGQWYMQLVSGIAKRAKMLTRVTATESPSDNDKFTMRLFLVSLNFKGPEYAFARKFLLRNLSGNSGWRTEEAKARHDAHKIRTEIEAPEVTINQASIEGGEADAGISE